MTFHSPSWFQEQLNGQKEMGDLNRNIHKHSQWFLDVLREKDQKSIAVASNPTKAKNDKIDYSLTKV